MAAVDTGKSQADQAQPQLVPWFGRARLAESWWRQHWMMGCALAVGAVVRVVSMLGFRPALFTADSFVYLHYSVHNGLDWMRPVGYSYLLRLAAPFHSFDAVTGLQHLGGLAVAVAVYALLRSRDLPQWGATLAAAPTLLDPRQVWLEQSILPDLWFELLIVAAIVLVLTRRTPAWWRVAVAGFAVGWATVTRGNGFPIVAILLGFLLIRGVGWRKTGVAALTCALPVLGYMIVFDAANGQFTISQGDGLWLWARTMSFANCSVIKPPPRLVPLCPENQPGGPQPSAPAWSWDFLVTQRQPASYLWDKRSWLWTGPHPGLSPQGNKLARDFALRAIRAQPLDYARVVARDVLLTFLNTDHTYQFHAAPHVPYLTHAWRTDMLRYAGTTANSHGVQPWAFVMFGYQQAVYFPGVAFALVMLLGLIRIGVRLRQPGRRARAAPAAAAWLTAAAIIVLPVALHEYGYRYALPAVPLACLAAALTFERRRQVPADGGP